jgi:hypothetical protein
LKLIGVYARIYASCWLKAFAGIAKSPWTLLLPMGLLAGRLGAVLLLSPFGWFGGVALWLIFDALASSYLYFLGEVVAHTRVTLSEFRKSVGAYFWSIVNYMFVWWIARILLNMVLANNPQSGLVWNLIWLAAFVLLNAVPEVLYQKGTYGGLATMQRTMQFIQENWIEWFVPNLLFGAGAWWVWTHLPMGGFGLGLVGFIIVGGALLHVLMVFRGHLFEVLDGSTHRQRMFRYRPGT